MEISKILTADVLDIIFEGRNKSYGAYELRKTYKRRLLMSISGMLSVLLLFIGGYVFANMGKKEQIVKDIFIPETTLEQIDPDKPQEPPPVKEPPPMKQMETKAFTNIKIAPDEEVKPEEAPPPVDDLDDVKIGTKNVDGFKDDGLAGPPPDENNGKGITAIEKKPEEDYSKIFAKVEIESKYPGGDPAWRRFLDRNLARNIPQEAIDNGIQGRVEIMFVVDSSGNVSNVQAVSGPAELHEAAIRVIQKSGKWEPAVQNGRHVHSYKRQPIVFKLADE